MKDYIKAINPIYTNGFESASASNDAADEIIAAPDRHLLSQSQLFAAQGGWATVAMALGATAVGTAAVFIGSPRTAAHFKNGSLTFLEWACLGTSGLFWYTAGSQVGQYAAGNPQLARNHWMAYTFVKS